MTSIRQSHFFMVVLTLITIMSLFGAFLHHHAAHEDHGCPVCRLIQVLSTALLFAVFVLFIEPVKKLGFVPFSKKAFQPVLLPVTLKDRAPPVSSSK